MANETHALGLPEGSIRAIIALGLILLFFLMSFNLFGFLLEVQTMTVRNLTQAEVEQIPADEIAAIRPNSTNPDNVDVDRIIGPTPASQEIAKQLITTLSTLVVAVAAFYFGTTSVAQAMKAGGRRGRRPFAKHFEAPQVSSPTQKT